MNNSDALTSLQAMAQHLTSSEIANVFNNECSQDFNQSVDYLLAMAKHSPISKCKAEKKSLTNKTITKTNEIYAGQSEEMFVHFFLF